MDTFQILSIVLGGVTVLMIISHIVLNIKHKKLVRTLKSRQEQEIKNKER